jgi:hypothetical protein
MAEPARSSGPAAKGGVASPVSVGGHAWSRPGHLLWARSDPASTEILRGTNGMSYRTGCLACAAGMGAVGAVLLGLWVPHRSARRGTA